MQVTETLSDGLKRAYTVVVPAADIESRRMARLTDLGKTLRLPGFRPGKVPLPVVKQRYGTAVSAEVLEESVNEATRQVLSERGLRPAQQPKVDLVTADPAQAGTTDLEFKVELELLPDITLPDFGSVALTRLKAEVAPEAIDKALGEIATRNRDLQDIPAEELGDRGAAKGEVLTVDYLGKLDGTPFPGGTGTDTDVEIGGTGFIPGFSEQMEGMKPGDVRVIDVTFPEEYGSKELAGKAATFDITAKQLRKAVVPAADEALATKLGFETLEELRGVISQQMQRELDGLTRLRIKRQLLDALSDLANFAAPEGMVEQEFAQIWQRLESDRAAGKLDEDDKDKDEDTLKAEYRAIAERRVRLGLLLAEIGRVNAITVSPDELSRAMRAEASRYPGQEAQMMELFRKYPAAADSLRGPIFEDKVVDFILELAKVTDETVTPEQLAEEPPPPGAPKEEVAAAEPAA
ncbi:MAG: trigger factor [Acetobacteraceae bacterium]|nr:trigger factor [Acetobacteraceae bacterium]